MSNKKCTLRFIVRKDWKAYRVAQTRRHLVLRCWESLQVIILDNIRIPGLLRDVFQKNFEVNIGDRNVRTTWVIICARSIGQGP